MNTPVSFELSKELKEKGFDLPCRLLYKSEKELEEGIGVDYDWNKFDSYSAPTIAEVVCWIYNKYDIWISLIPDSSSGYRLLNRKFSVSIFRFNMNLNVQVEIIRKNKDILYFNLPENAFDYAINYTIKNLIQ